MGRFDVTALGEGGLRLSAPPGHRLDRAEHLDVAVAGTEANVLCSLSSLGWKTAWSSGLPNSPLGHRVAAEYLSYGLNLEGVTWSEGGRVGVYFGEYASRPGGTQLLFDRAGTVFSTLTTDDITWPQLLDTRLLHLTGLTAGISASARELVYEAAERARSAQVPVSFDVNYRSHLWSAAYAAEHTAAIMRDVEILLCRREDAERLFQIVGSTRDRVRQLKELSGARYVLMTLGEDGFVADLDGKYIERPAADVTIVNRLGAGDGFAAGFIDGWLCGDVMQGTESAPLLAAVALSQFREPLSVTRDELTRLLDPDKTELNR